MSQERNFSIEPLEGRRLLSGSSISGFVFTETNADGVREAGEPGFAAQTVYLDTNFDGVLDNGDITESTASNGSFEFDNLQAGVYRLGVVTPGGYRQTSPSQGFYDIVANGSDIHAAEDFGMTTTAIIHGNVFNDTNGDGVLDNGEHGIANVLVFLDKNKNGKLDKGEKSRLTNSAGAYRFAGLTPGTYYIRVSPSKLFAATSPGLIKLPLAAAQSKSNRNFGLESA